jgi:predicted O-methyltransferase YrrM
MIRERIITMFQQIGPAILERMRALEQIDQDDRADGTPRLQRLRQVSPDTGKLLAMLAANTPPGAVLEIGTSAGYSTMWLALACLETKRKVTTFEVLEEKIRLARETFRMTGLDSTIELVHGDAREHLTRFEEIAFCFLDAEKDIYADCYEAVVPRLVHGGVLAADNVISHQKELQPFVDRALADGRVDAVVIPIGQGVLLCRKA